MRTRSLFVLLCALVLCGCASKPAINKSGLEFPTMEYSETAAGKDAGAPSK